LALAALAVRALGDEHQLLAVGPEDPGLATPAALTALPLLAALALLALPLLALALLPPLPLLALALGALLEDAEPLHLALAALALAVLANRALRGIGFFRFLYASTISISTAIASTIFLLMFSFQIGTINYLLDLVGIQPVPWLLSPEWAPVSIAIATIWSTLGFTFIVLLSGMQGIPEELYESAALDGAHGWSLFRHITIPLLSPTLFFLIVVSTIAVFQAFTQIYVMTKGGPSDSTYSIVYSIYEEAFIRFQFGSASAQAVILFIIMLSLTIIQFQVIERRVHYG